MVEQSVGHAVSHSQPDMGDVSVACSPVTAGIPQSGDAYFNTTRLEGEALTAAIRAATQQNIAILAIFRAAGIALSPSEVWRRCNAAGKRWPLTSVRRALCNLTDVGALVKLESKRIGEFGRYEFEWSLVP